MPTKQQLEDLQKASLFEKIILTKQRIREWVSHFGEDGVYVSFSGGKDSTVLLHLVREDFPDVEAVFVNTGLEYPEIQIFVKSFDNVTILRPKMSFVEVIKKYGYPIVSKDIALTIYYYRKGSNFAKERVYGIDAKTKGESEFRKERYGKWKPLTEVDFNISSYCCKIMKENPIDKWSNKNSKVCIMGTLAEESERRTDAWLKTGCNAFESKKPSSKPLSFWTEQDVLQYISQNNIPIASVYGEIIPDTFNDGQIAIDNSLVDLKCTGCQRTGCIFCGFGAHLEKGEGRFERLKRTHPKQYEYCLGGGEYNEEGLWQPNEKGLGMKHVFDAFNELYPNTPIRY